MSSEFSTLKRKQGSKSSSIIMIIDEEAMSEPGNNLMVDSVAK